SNSAVAELGRLRLRVSDAEPGSTVKVLLKSKSNNLRLFPATDTLYRLHAQSTSGEYYLNFGGQMQISNGKVGWMSEDIEVETTCQTRG
ncbi:MAG: hypothetical protein ACPGSC_07250, partial [Granulosicoccaceae bacterium]